MPKSFFIVVCFFLPPCAFSQTVDFSFQSDGGLFCNPSTIHFTQNCTGNPTGFIWYLGNGLTSNAANPTTSYSNGGTYRVKLIAIFGQSVLEVTKTITISPTILPKIGFDRNYICQPGVINFTAQSNGGVNKYDWDFGDTSGIVSNPTNTAAHNYTNYGTYNVVVTTTNAQGCSGQDTILVEVKKIPVNATADRLSGCIASTVNFVSADTIPLNSTVSSYAWDFGDGNTTSTATGAVNHTYGVVGKFSPTLNITTSEGCTSTFNFPEVAFGTAPSNTVAYPKKTVVCGSETPLFVAKATKANNYTWDFGDDSTGTASDTVTGHKYTTIGVKTVKVTPDFNGCPGPSKTFQIEVNGVIASYYINNSCDDKRTFLFRSTSSGNKTSFDWNFGDGTSDSNPNSTTHTYPPSGVFKSNLTVADETTGCTDTFSLPVYTGSPILQDTDTALCRNAETTFTIADNYKNPSAFYVWNVVGRRVATDEKPRVTIKATVLGDFKNYVEIRNGSGFCRDTVYLDHNIRIKGPDLSFTVPESICFGELLNITNTSKPSVQGETITSWYWNFGNTDPVDTSFQPAPFQYTGPRTYQITLAANDINGCTDTLINPVAVNSLPFLQLLQDTDTLCSGSADTLYAFHSDSIVWSPSNSLSCATCDTVVSKPTSTTQYFIRAVTPFNCSIQDSILVKVIPPFKASSPLGSQFICLNESVTLDMEPKDKVIVWSPVNGLSNINIYNPVAKPAQATTYTATLTDSLGCFTSSADITVAFKSIPSVDAGPDRVVQYNAPFSITPLYSSNVRSYLWTPSSLLSCSSCPNPAGIAAYSQTYTIEVTSDSGCVFTDQITIALECKEANILMPSAFTPNNDNLNDYYYPVTRGIKTIIRFDVYNRAGQILYQARNFVPNNKSFAWDGNYKGRRQSAEAYVYVLEALCEVGERLVKKGSFMLLR